MLEGEVEPRLRPMVRAYDSPQDELTGLVAQVGQWVNEGVTPEEIAELEEYIRVYFAPRGDQVYGETLLRTASDDRMRHLRQVLELESTIIPALEVA